MDKENISVKDIARMANTSVATVSRVINQNGRFSRETEKRVREIIEEYNYHPNELARGLRVKQTRVIGILVPDITNAFFSDVTKVVQNELMMRGYMTLICSSNENVEEAKKQVQMLLGQKVSGIIYIGEAEITDSMGIPTVYIDRDPRNTRPELGDDFELIECDNIQGGYLAGQELVKKGAKRIGYICHKPELSTIQKRLQGFETALCEMGIPFEPEACIAVGEATIKEGALATKQLLSKISDLDGIFYMSDVLALGGLNYLHSQGILIPDQIRLVGFDDISICDAVYPGLTTIHQPVEEMGKLAVEHILDILNGKKVEFRRQRIPVRLIVRGTT